MEIDLRKLLFIAKYPLLLHWQVTQDEIEVSPELVAAVKEFLGPAYGVTDNVWFLFDTMKLYERMRRDSDQTTDTSVQS